MTCWFPQSLISSSMLFHSTYTSVIQHRIKKSFRYIIKVIVDKKTILRLLSCHNSESCHLNNCVRTTLYLERPTKLHLVSSSSNSGILQGSSSASSYGKALCMGGFNSWHVMLRVGNRFDVQKNI